MDKLDPKLVKHIEDSMSKEQVNIILTTSIIFGSGYLLKYMALGWNQTILIKLTIDSLLILLTGVTYMNMFGV